MKKRLTSLPLAAMTGIFLVASSQAAITVVDTDFAATAANSGPGDFALSAQGPGTRDGIYTYSYNAGAAFDMLVVGVAREASGPGANVGGAVFSVTYGGVAMNFLSGAGSADASGSSIFYLATNSASGDIALDFTGYATVNGIGIGIMAINSSTGDVFITDQDTAASSVTLNRVAGDVAFFMGDANSTLGTPTVDSPLTSVNGGSFPADIGSNQAGSGYEEVTSDGSQVYTWSPNSDARSASGAVFSSVPEPSSVALFGLGLTAVCLVRRRRA